MNPIGVLGDLHLGRSIYGYSLTPKIRSTMYRFFRFCVEHKVKIAVQLGDIFDNPRPTIEQEKIAIQWCNEFERAGINLFLINGNHDATGKTGIGSALDVIRASRLKFVTVINRPTLIERLPRGPYSGPPLYFLPFPCPSIYRDSKTWKKAVKGSGWKDGSIVFCHLNIDGAKVGEQDFPYRGSDYTLPQKTARLLSKLVIAGHIHKPQKVGSMIHVVGAAERLRFDERNDERYFTLLLPDHLGYALPKQKQTYPVYVKRYKRSDAIKLRQLKLDASGGELTTTEDVKVAISDQDVKGTIVKVVPYVDELSTVDWNEVASALYRQGADHVVVAPPKKVKAKVAKRIAKGRIDNDTVARRFIVARIKDKRERKLIYKRFKRIAG